MMFDENREYPRWVHHEGRESAVANTPEEEAVLLAAWGGPAKPAEPVLPPAPTRYLLTADYSGAIDEHVDPDGGWVKWEDISTQFAPVDILDVDIPDAVDEDENPLIATKPRGRPRKDA